MLFVGKTRVFLQFPPDLEYPDSWFWSTPLEHFPFFHGTSSLTWWRVDAYCLTPPMCFCVFMSSWRSWLISFVGTSRAFSSFFVHCALHPPSSPSLLLPFSRFPPPPPPPQKQQVGLKNFLGPKKFFNPKKFLNRISVACLEESRGGRLPKN